VARGKSVQGAVRRWRREVYREHRRFWWLPGWLCRLTKHRLGRKYWMLGEERNRCAACGCLVKRVETPPLVPTEWVEVTKEELVADALMEDS